VRLVALFQPVRVSANVSAEATLRFINLDVTNCAAGSSSNNISRPRCLNRRVTDQAVQKLQSC
jgi:hypothetical protein